MDDSDDDNSYVESSSEKIRFYEGSKNMCANENVQVKRTQAKFDAEKREVLRDVSKLKNHVYDQSSTKSRRNKDKLWELLLDNQSTCDVIINRKMLSNISKCRWTLRLQTQASEFVIDKVGDMKGSGVVWYFPDGVAIILSQFRMIVYSK